MIHTACAALSSQQGFLIVDGQIWHLKIFEFTGCYSL